jgi:hypothetical protein
MIKNYSTDFRKEFKIFCINTRGRMENSCVPTWGKKGLEKSTRQVVVLL